MLSPASSAAGAAPELMGEAALSARADAHVEEMVASKENIEGMDNGVAAYHESLKAQFDEQASSMYIARPSWGAARIRTHPRYSEVSAAPKHRHAIVACIPV